MTVRGIPVGIPSRAHRLRTILTELDLLIEGLDGSGHPCVSCGLTLKTHFGEAVARKTLSALRTKVAALLTQGQNDRASPFYED